MKKLLLTCATLLGLLTVGSANAVTITSDYSPGTIISGSTPYSGSFAIQGDLDDHGFNSVTNPYEFNSATIVFSFTDDSVGETTDSPSDTGFIRTGPTTEYRGITNNQLNNAIEIVDTYVGEVVSGNLISGSTLYSDTTVEGETIFSSYSEDYQYACGLFTLCDGTRTVNQETTYYERNEGYTGSFTITHTLTGVEFASLVEDGLLSYFIEITEGDLIFNSASLTFDVTAVPLAAVPIPPALFLFGSGLLGLLRIARVRRK